MIKKKNEIQLAHFFIFFNKLYYKNNFFNLFINFYIFRIHVLSKSNRLITFQQKSRKLVIPKFSKKFFKSNYTNIGMILVSKSLSSTHINPLFYNKLTCFWPILRQRNSLTRLLIRFFKKLKKNSIKFLFNLHNNIKKLKKSKTYKHKFIHIFLKKKKIKKKKSHFFNFHRRQIKIFWKSQTFFKLHFLDKTRFTTRKFKNKFNYWYKKVSKEKHKIHNRLSSILMQNFLFFSANHLNTFFDNGLISKNYKKCVNKHETIQKNDILTLPQNYASLLSTILLGRFFAVKTLKKKNYIYFKNKASQWKDIKKKQPKEAFYNLYTPSKIQTNLEFDIFTARLCLIDNHKTLQRFTNFTLRHNLEKLNTYKLNV